MKETDDLKNSAKLDEWCLVELFGHQRIVGHVTEATIAGGAFIRVDVPRKGTQGEETEFTRFFGPSAIYSLSPIGKEMAVEYAESLAAAPVHAYDVPKLAEKIGENFRARAVSLPEPEGGE